MTDRKEFVLQTGEKIIQFQESEDSLTALTNLGNLIYRLHAARMHGTEVLWRSRTLPKSKAENLQEASKTADSSKPEQVKDWREGQICVFESSVKPAFEDSVKEMIELVEKRTREIVAWEKKHGGDK